MAHGSLFIKVSVKVAWWVRPYIFGVEMACLLTGRKPDFDKVNRVIERGVTPKIEG